MIENLIQVNEWVSRVLFIIIPENPKIFINHLQKTLLDPDF